MKNSLLFVLALCSASVLASPVGSSLSLSLQDSDEDLTPHVSNQLKNSDEDTSKPPTKDSLATAQGTTSTIQESHLQKLDEDIILDIFSRITFADVLRLRATSKYFQSISTETVEMPFLDVISNYNRDDLTDQRLIPLVCQAFPDHVLPSRWVRAARCISRLTYNVRTFEQVLVGLARFDSPSVRRPVFQPVARTRPVLITYFERFIRFVTMRSEDHVESAPTIHWPENENQVTEFLGSALTQVAESFKNDEYDLDHNDRLEMELAVAFILYQRCAPNLFTRPSVVIAENIARFVFGDDHRIILNLNDEDIANIERGKAEALGPDYEKILGLVHIVQDALRKVKLMIRRKQLEENADVEAVMIPLLVPELGMDQESIKEVFQQARWSVKLGFAVKYRLTIAVRGLLKDKDAFGPTIEKQYNAAIISKYEPLIKAFEESGLVKIVKSEAEAKVETGIQRKEEESGTAISIDNQKIS